MPLLRLKRLRHLCYTVSPFRHRRRGCCTFSCSSFRRLLGRCRLFYSCRRRNRKCETRLLRKCERLIESHAQKSQALATLSASLLIVLMGIIFALRVRPVLLLSTSPFSANLKTGIAFYLCLIAFYNHQKCIWTAPGFVTADVARAQSVCTLMDPELRVDDEYGMRRRCDSCQLDKAWRSHHCKVCNRCVLRMDHHCVFIWNCVGFYNHRYFFIMCLVSLIGCLYFMWFAITPLYQTYYDVSFPCLSIHFPYFLCAKKKFEKTVNQMDDDHYGLLWYAFNGYALIAILLSILVKWHIELLIWNQTTLERLAMTKNHKVDSDFRSDLKIGEFRNCEMNHHYIYSLDSVFENIKQVFGSKWYLCLLPIPYQPIGNGYEYPLRAEIKQLLYDESRNNVNNI